MFGFSKENKIHYITEFYFISYDNSDDSIPLVSAAGGSSIGFFSIGFSMGINSFLIIQYSNHN